MHSVVHNYCNTSFNNVQVKKENRQIDHNLSNVDDFLLPPVRIEQFRKFPVYSFAYLWNTLGDLKLQLNPITFKISLENELFEQLVEMQ